MFTGVMANITVKDSNRAQDWYTRLFGREPDTAPMAGLIEWHLGPGIGVQIWADPDRAGCSSVVIHDSALDALADRLTAVGFEHGGPEPGGGQRILRITDPDGNHIVFAGE
ncbi:VOC family protein [Brevibacterium sp. CBA3109]|uniref:VOC family protein n=1 Tax=Brevibacterium koreense TaxID=3140787 RepID=A0AAU7URB2_9MICO